MLLPIEVVRATMWAGRGFETLVDGQRCAKLRPLEFLTARKPPEPAHRAFEQWQGLQRALLACGLLLEIPRVVTGKKLIPAGLDGVTEDIGAARLVAGVDPGAVKRTRQVNHSITRTHRNRDAVCQIRRRNRL